MAENSLCVIWIDWYAYHVARFRALTEHPHFQHRITGIEMVGGAGVHEKLVFRSLNRGSLPIETLMPQSSWQSASGIDIALRVWRKLNQLNPGVVLVPGYYTVPGLAAAVWSKCHGRTSVLMTESTREDHHRVWWKEALKKILLKALFDGAIAGGRRHVAYLKELGVRGRIGNCYDVVDNEFFSVGAEAAHAAGRPDHLPSRYFLYVGRLSPEKNLAMLIRSFAVYQRRGGDWFLILVGDGPERGELEALAAEEHVSSQVRFEGQRSTEEMVPYYAFAGCFVLPSAREPWGLVVNEAMAAGLPVIVSERCGCVEDLVAEGVNGYTVDASRPQEITEAFFRICRLTPSERAEMGANSRRQVSKYSLQRWAEEVFQLVH